MFTELAEIFTVPEPFECANTPDLWNTPHIAKQMLKFHLDPDHDAASRNKKFVDKSIQWLIEEFNIGVGSKTLDLGCGPGLYTHAFAMAGAEVTGVDLSTNSINYARAKAEEDGLAIDYVNSNYLDYQFDESYDLITIIYCDFCVLSPTNRKLFLKKVFDALKNDGHFVFDVASDHHFDSRQKKQACYHEKSSGFWSPNEHFVFDQVHKYEQERIILEQNTVIEQEHQFTIYNYLKCFQLEEIVQELSENGFRTTAYFSDISGSVYEENSEEIALVNKKAK